MMSGLPQYSRHALAAASVAALGLLLTGITSMLAHEEYQRELDILSAPLMQRAELCVARELAEHYERLESWRDAIELVPHQQKGSLDPLFRSYLRSSNMPGIREVAVVRRAADAGGAQAGLVREAHFVRGQEGNAGAWAPDQPGLFERAVAHLTSESSLALMTPAQAGLGIGKGWLMVLPILDRPISASRPRPVSRWLVGVVDFHDLMIEAMGPMSPMLALVLRQPSSGATIGSLQPEPSSHRPMTAIRQASHNLALGPVPLELVISVPGGMSLGDEVDWTWIIAVAGTVLSMLLAYVVHAVLIRRHALSEQARQLQISVRDSEQRFRDIVESSRDWVWETDRQGVYLYSSPSSERLFGYAPGRIVGTRGEFLWSKSEPVPATGEQSRIRVARHSSGASVTLESRSFPMYTAEGEAAGFRGFDRDISQRMELESELHTLQGRLLKVIQAEGAGTTLMGLAHEINQPLAAIAAYNQACLRMAESERGMKSEIVAAIRATADNAMLAGDIIRKFRGVVAAAQVSRTALPLHKVVQDTVEIARSRIRSEQIRMVISVGTELPEVLGDATLIKQVILNLVGNAVDAMTEGSERVLRVLAHRVGPDKIRVEIADSGPGVREELRERIFEPYFTTKAGGLGMGLAISKAIIEAHGESIGYEARPEGGTTFWFTLSIWGG